MRDVLPYITAVLLFVLISGGLYFLVLVPRRWRIPLATALPLLDGDDRANLEVAERLIGTALSAGPRGRALADIRFAYAYVRAMLGQYDAERYSAAATTVGELATTSGHDGASAYLELWLQSRLDNHDRVCEIYDAHADLLQDRLQTRFIAAISHLHKAVEHWGRREPEGAVHYLDRVRDLGELTDHIPPQIDDLQLMHGIQAIFDQRPDDARRSFAGARDRASTRGRSTAEAELGLLACDWRGQPGPLDERLAAVLAELDQQPPASPDGQALRANAALLHLTLLLRGWAERPARSGLPNDSRAELDRRAERVLAADPELGDAYLLAWLTRYYFARGQAEREAALAGLQRGTEVSRAIVLPEVLDLINAERRIGDQGDALARYQALLHEFLADPELPAAHRAELRQLAARFARFQDPGEVATDAEPHRRLSVEDHSRRSELLHQRIMLITYPTVRDSADGPAARELATLTKALDGAAERFTKDVAELREAEHDVIVQTAELLLPEEPDEDRP